MKISSRGRYGLRIMLDIAIHGGEQPRLIRDIAKSQKLSEKYVGTLANLLRKGGLIVSARGVNGGYKLGRSASDISLLEITEATEGTVSIVDCVKCPQKCRRAHNCPARAVWSDINSKIKSALSDFTLSDVIGRNETFADEDFCI